MTASTEQHETETTESQRRQDFASFKRLLKNRHFLLLWMAQLISLTILNAANFGVVLQITDMTHSVFLVGLSIIAFTLPAVPFSAVAGALVDKLNKRMVLWVSNILRAGTMLLLFVSLVLDHTDPWPVFVLTYLTALIGQFFIPAESVAIPLLVGKHELVSALSLFSISLSISQAVGFLLLGRVVATLFPPFSLSIWSHLFYVQSANMVFAIVAVLYVVCAVLILCIPVRAFEEEHLHKPEGDNDAPSTIGKSLALLWDDMVEGWSIVRADRLLLFSVVQLSLVGVLMLLVGELAGTFVQEILHRPPEDMSIILAPAGFGLIGASIVMPQVTHFVGKVRLTTIGFIVLAFGFVLLPASQWLALRLDPLHGAESVALLWTTVILVFLLGGAMAVVNVPTQTIMQQQAPVTGRARVFSLQFMMYNVSSIPILLFAGVIERFLGFNQLIFAISSSLLLFSLWGWWYVRGSREF